MDVSLLTSLRLIDLYSLYSPLLALLRRLYNLPILIEHMSLTILATNFHLILERSTKRRFSRCRCNLLARENCKASLLLLLRRLLRSRCSFFSREDLKPVLLLLLRLHMANLRQFRLPLDVQVSSFSGHEFLTTYLTAIYLWRRVHRFQIHIYPLIPSLSIKNHLLLFRNNRVFI